MGKWALSFPIFPFPTGSFTLQFLCHLVPTLVQGACMWAGAESAPLGPRLWRTLLRSGESRPAYRAPTGHGLESRRDEANLFHATVGRRCEWIFERLERGQWWRLWELSSICLCPDFLDRISFSWLELWWPSSWLQCQVSFVLCSVISSRPRDVGRQDVRHSWRVPWSGVGNALCSPLLSLKSGGQVWPELDQFSGLPASTPLLRESSLWLCWTLSHKSSNPSAPNPWTQEISWKASEFGIPVKLIYISRGRRVDKIQICGPSTSRNRPENLDRKWKC